MLYRRGEVWWVKFEHRGKRYRLSTGTGHRRKAEVEGARLKAAFSRDAGPRPRLGAVPTLTQCCAVDVREAQDRALHPGYVGALESHWVAIMRHFGEDAPLDAVTHATLIEYEGERRRAGIRGQSIRKEVGCLKRAFERERLSGQPIDAPLRWPKITSDPPDPRKRGKLIEDADLARYLDALPVDFRDEMTVARLTGLRWGELARLTIEWVQRDQRRGWLLKVPATASKTRRERVVHLPADARAILVRRSKRIDGCLFPRDRWTGRDEMAAAAIAAKLEHAPTLRDLRTSYGTVTLERSGDAAGVMAALGHSDLRTTQRYQRTTLERLHRVGEAGAIRPQRPATRRHGRKTAARRKSRRAA